MVSAIGADTWKVVIALKLWSAVAKAVIVTVVPTMAGNPEPGRGITKVTLSPGDEWGTAKPSPPPTDVQSMPPQFAFQSTPRPAGSPATVADRIIVEPAGAIGGGN